MERIILAEEAAIAECKEYSNPTARFLVNNEIVRSFFEANELPIEEYRPIKSSQIRFGQYRHNSKGELIFYRSTPISIKDEDRRVPLEEVADEDGDPLAILIRKEEGRLRRERKLRRRKRR